MAEPETWDWCDKGAVAPVKKQIGSTCWVFALTSSVESKNQILNGELVTLSEQYLIECDQTFNRGGFKRGSVRKAIKFLMKHHGRVYRDSDYPFTDVLGPCRCQDLAPYARVTGFKRVTRNSEAALKTAVLKQPVTAFIDGRYLNENGRQFRGIHRFDPATPIKRNHYVLVVGYGTENGVDFWKCRNSWGARWGDDGYFRVERNIGDDHRQGTFGIASKCYYPVNVRVMRGPYRGCCYS